jgi:hypothetical protein
MLVLHKPLQRVRSISSLTKLCVLESWEAKRAASDPVSDGGSSSNGSSPSSCSGMAASSQTQHAVNDRDDPCVEWKGGNWDRSLLFDFAYFLQCVWLQGYCSDLACAAAY